MENERWRRLQELYEEAETRPPSQRLAYLNQACPDDEEMRREIEAMLDLTVDSESIIIGPVAEAARLSFPAAQEGERIGSWRLIRPLGEGGMGTVYLAERDDQSFQKQAALKLLRSGLASEDLRTRFRSERQILATLEHPNIARLLDGGETADGRPWVVIELVEGQTLTEYCRLRLLNLEQRVRLMLAVCDAVAYAHTHLIVHRDLKPANILVTEDGTPKLLDFGIAKLLEPGSFPAPVAQTQFADRILTPEFAAPEQITTNAVSTATDVYQLGLLLYVLAARRGPWDVAKMAPHELSAAIVSEDPPPPSRWAKVPEDLETVILMALRKEPGRRYTSAALLAQDLQRWLDGFPVSARRDTWRYRTSKFIRRNRLAVAAGVLFVVSLAGLSAGLYMQAQRAERERSKAQKVADFLVDIFKVSDPGQERGRDITAKEILEEGSERVERELGGSPEAQGLLLDQLSRTWRNLGDLDKALALAERSLEIRRRTLGEDNADTAKSLQSLGHILTVSGKYKEAEPYLRRALDIDIRKLGANDSETAATQNLLGMLLYYQGRYDEAGPVLEASIATARRLGSDNGELAALSLNNLALVRRDQGRLAEAEQAFREALESQRPVLGPDHPSIALYTANLGLILYNRGRHYQAEPLFREALGIWRRVHKGNDDHTQVALGLQYLASCLAAEGRIAESEPIWRKLIASRTRSMGADNVFVVGDRAGLGNVLRMKGAYEEAESTLEDVLSIREKKYPPGDPWLAASYTSLAQLRRDQGRLAEAETLLRKALEIRDRRPGRDNPYSTAGTRLELAWNLQAQGRAGEARPLFREVLDLRRAKLPKDEWALSDALLAQGFVSQDMGMLREALAIRQALRPEGHWEVAEVQWALTHSPAAKSAILAGPEHLRARIYLGVKP